MKKMPFNWKYGWNFFSQIGDSLSGTIDFKFDKYKNSLTDRHNMKCNFYKNESFNYQQYSVLRKKAKLQRTMKIILCIEVLMMVQYFFGATSKSPYNEKAGLF